jgi:hypothetical protein
VGTFRAEIWNKRAVKQRVSTAFGDVIILRQLQIVKLKRTKILTLTTAFNIF